MRYLGALNSLILSFAATVIAFVLLAWLKVPVGSFGDWIISLMALIWMVLITTVPWNVYFHANTLLAEAGPAQERGSPVAPAQLAYVTHVRKLALGLAIGLHVFSAVALFALAATGLTRIGYVASVLALLLTGLRPAMSAYQYISQRLAAIRHGWNYPHQDVYELRQRIDAMEQTVKTTEAKLNLDAPDSLASALKARTDENRGEIVRVAAELQNFRAANQVEHETLAREARSAISQLNGDGQFLDHVREILRFFKQA
jgi:hypothetical protein